MKAFILFSLLTTSAFAQIQFSDDKTKFQTLLDSYLQAQAPATYADFPGTPASTKKCVVVTPKDPDKALPVFAAVREFVLVPGTPDRVIPAEPANGPLFPAKPERRIPGTPAVTEPRMVLGNKSVTTTGQDQLKLIVNTHTATDLVITVPAGFYSDIKLESKISFRRVDGYTPFVLEVAPYTDKLPMFAGYCF